MVEHSLGVGVLQPQDQGDDVGSSPAMPSIKPSPKIQADQLRTNGKPAGNSTYKKLAAHWLNEALCFVSSFVVADSSVLRNRQLLVAANRYSQCP